MAATVKNQGSGESAATTLRYYSSTDATITTSDTALGTDSVGSLAAAGTSDQSIELTAPSTAGTYYYGACVAAVSDESDTTNNCSSALALTIGAPDLVVSTPTVDSASQTVGASFTLNATVRNQGSSGAVASTLRYYRSADTTITTSDTSLGTDSISALAAFGTSDQSIDLTAPSDVGTYYYGACVDAVTGESSTTNNCSSALTVTVEEETSTAPDLVVSASRLNSPYIDVGSTVTLRTTVRNQGSGESDATTLRYYRSTDYRSEVSGATEVGTASVGALAAGGNSSLPIDLTPPLVADKYYFAACADTVSDETDITNNCSHWSSVTVDPPDLTVSVSKDGANLVVGESFTLEVRVRNSDIGGSSATTLRYYRSIDATITTSDTELGTASVGALAANGSSYLPIDLTAPSTAGTYYYGACVDAVPGESDTNNNCSRALKVVVDATAAPDLIVYRPYHSAGNLLVGASFTLNATVKNQGSAASGSTTLRYYRSTDDTITTSDTALGTDSVSSIASGSTSAQSIDLTAPSEAGTYYYGVCVDSVTDESVTNNNCSSGLTVIVNAEAAPDLDITGLFAAGPLDGSYPTSLSAWREEPGQRIVGRHYAAFLSLDGRDDHHFGHRVGHRSGGRPVPVGHQQPWDQRHYTTVRSGHLLLRGLRGRGPRRIGHYQQLLGFTELHRGVMTGGVVMRYSK